MNLKINSNNCIIFWHVIVNFKNQNIVILIFAKLKIKLILIVSYSNIIEIKILKLNIRLIFKN